MKMNLVSEALHLGIFDVSFNGRLSTYLLCIFIRPSDVINSVSINRRSQGEGGLLHRAVGLLQCFQPAQQSSRLSLQNKPSGVIFALPQ